MIKIGKIINNFSLKGNVKIFPLTNFKEMFLKINRFYIKNNKEKFVFFYVENLKIINNIIIIKFKNIDSINDANKLKNKYIYVKKNMLPKLSDNEFYNYKIIGMDVFTKNNIYIGKIKDILEIKNKYIYIIKKENYRKEILIPSVSDFIIERNFKERKMVVNILPGLLN